MTLSRDEAVDAFGKEHAEFRNFVCWQPERVTHVMDTEALQTAPEVFLATHSPLPMFRSDLSEDGSFREYDESALLRDFREAPDYAFIAVLGGAGTGKSHLVRWLATRITSNERRRVLLIPRAGTSLHEVLRRVLDGIEGDRFDDYRKRLGESSTAISLDEARQRLLDNLAVAIGTTGQTGDIARSEAEDYLAAELPNLLRDPVFRPHFLHPDGVLDRTARHVVGGSGVERVEERRAFGIPDLPLRIKDATDASEPAKRIQRDLVANPDLQHAAAGWLTRHLDDAVTQLMRFGGTDLLQLMIDVRAELATRKVELVILIEDLATLQGIDQQLLEALIIKPQQPGMPRLSALRAAVAMTGGYYEGLRKNVQQRFDFRVVMGEQDTRGRTTHRDVERFTARYLNAVRLSDRALGLWYQGTQDSANELERAPSACRECPFQKPCHRAFGEHEGMGLYPFSPIAITRIGERVSPAGFNPRMQLKEGYKPILENDALALRDGRFPTPELLMRLGGPRLRPILVTELRRSDPQNHARRAVLLDLWADRRDVIDLDPVLQKAFDLPRFGGRETLSSETVPVEAEREDDESIGISDYSSRPQLKPTGSEKRSPAELRLEAQLQGLDAWSNGGAISQDLMQDLREVVYAAVLGHIDWNALHLIPGEFSGTKGFRQRNSINFARQILPPARASIQLPIPLAEQDLVESALALQGLIRYRHLRSWQFDDGGRYYRAYLRQVSSWARHVVAQVNRVRENDAPWDPVPAASELLVIGARVIGRPQSRDPERGELLDAMFADPPDQDESDRSDAWQRLTKVVRKHQSKVQELVLARIACSKGASRKIQVIDAARVLPVVTEVRRTLRPNQEVPSDLERTSHFLLEYRDAIVEHCEEALAAEAEHQLKRYEGVARQLSPEDDQPDTAAAERRATAAALREVLGEATKDGVLAGVQRAAFEERLAEFEKVQFKAWAEAVQRLHQRDDFAQLLADVSLIPASTARVASEFVDTADRMLLKTEEAVLRDVDENEREGTEELERVQESILLGLRSLERELMPLGREETQ